MPVIVAFGHASTPGRLLRSGHCQMVGGSPGSRQTVGAYRSIPMLPVKSLLLHFTENGKVQNGRRDNVKYLQSFLATVTFMAMVFTGGSGHASAAGCSPKCPPTPNTIDFGTGQTHSGPLGLAVTGKAKSFKRGTPVFAVVHLIEPLGAFVREIILFRTGGRTSVTHDQVRRTPGAFQKTLNFLFEVNGNGRMSPGKWIYRFQHGNKIIAHGSFRFR